MKNVIVVADWFIDEGEKLVQLLTEHSDKIEIVYFEKKFYSPETVLANLTQSPSGMGEMNVNVIASF